MSEKPSHALLLGGDHHDGLVHPTAPPSYDEAMDAANRANQPPYNPYQGYPTVTMPNPVPQPIPQPVPQQVPVYPHQVVNVPCPPATMPAINVAFPAPQVLPVGPKAARITCYHCGANVKTTIVKSNKASAHMACLLLCIFMCCLCSWIPYCMSSFKKVDHKCPNCKGYLGSYNA